MNPRSLLPAVILLATTLSAQQPRVDETIEVSIVNVDVLVTDKKGNRVTGLTADDFEIREEGKLQPITNFAEYTPAVTGTGASVETAAPAAAMVRPRRTIVVFIESMPLNPFNSVRMYDSLRSLIRDTVEKGDRVTIVTWKQAVLVKQPFTDDVAVLDAVLAKMEKEQPRYARDEGRDVRNEQAESDAAEAEMAAITGAASGSMPPVQSLEAAKRQYAQIRQKAAVLEALMQGISALDGRKIIIMAMRRFGVFAGAEFFGGELPIERRAEFTTQPFRDSLIRMANAHGITLYPIFPPGLVADPLDAANPGSLLTNPDADLAQAALPNKVMFNETTALQDLAAGTGGLMAWGAGNIAEMLPRVGDDLESYYSLGYRSRATGKDITRKIVVRTKNPAYEVRSRRQFVEKSDDSRMHDRVIAGLYQPLEGSTVRFDVGVGEAVADGRKRWTVPLKIRIPIAELTTLQQGRNHAGEFSVYVVTGAVVGVMSEVQRRTQPFQIPLHDLQKAKSSHFTYDFTLRVDEQVDRVSVGIFDEVGKEFGLRRIALPPRTSPLPATGRGPG